ncbi:Hypothetical predicted protein [Paramuricea clavata]|uniref:Uncharacterized protein n=1 Tax=Paramuricea clavata TaxID=317549 RepID=A0A6S7IYB3_PARCT|nr:Hypothetical predicted protein [Paramuricea clavata]
MAENVVEVDLKIEFSLKNFETKKGRDTTLTEIKKNVCALLNTDGGRLVLIANDATDDNTINADIVVRPIEQQFKNIIGSGVHYKFDVVEQTNNKITLDIQRLPKLCTLTTNLFLPTNTEIQLFPATEQNTLKHILFERCIVEISEQTLPEQFSSGSKCGIRESKTVQFKCLKTEKKGKTDFADRVINNKQLGRWKTIENKLKILNEQSDLLVNAKLVYLFQSVIINYRQGNFEGAEKYLNEFRTTANSAEDKSILDVEERYLTSAIECFRRDNEKAGSIIQQGLALAENAPAGFVPASFYAHAASVLSYLVNDESFIGESKDQNAKDLEVHKHIERAKDLCYKALQHLTYIENDFEIAREELRRRISITLALLYLRPIDHVPISSSDIDIVAATISESEQSLLKLKGTPRFAYKYCRLLMVKSDLCLRKYQLMPTDAGIELVEKSLEYVQEAQELARTSKN